MVLIEGRKIKQLFKDDERIAHTLLCNIYRYLKYKEVRWVAEPELKHGTMCIVERRVQMYDIDEIVQMMHDRVKRNAEISNGNRTKPFWMHYKDEVERGLREWQEQKKES